MWMRLLINTALSAELFDILQNDIRKGKTRLKVKLKEGQSANNMLAALLPHVNIQRLDEVIPTMNDIFIDKVKTKD